MYIFYGLENSFCNKSFWWKYPTKSRAACWSTCLSRTAAAACCSKWVYTSTSGHAGAGVGEPGDCVGASLRVDLLAGPGPAQLAIVAPERGYNGLFFTSICSTLTETHTWSYKKPPDICHGNFFWSQRRRSTLGCKYENLFHEWTRTLWLNFKTYPFTMFNVTALIIVRNQIVFFIFLALCVVVMYL